MSQESIESSDILLIRELWQEHVDTPFPKGFRAKDVNGIDFVMLDADVAGCVTTFLKSGNLNLFQTARLGLCYRNARFVVPMLNDEGAAYFWRLERLAELVLKAVALENEGQHNKSLNRSGISSFHIRKT